MVLMMELLRSYCLETHCNILMVKFLDIMKASNWDYIMVKCLGIYLEM